MELNFIEVIQSVIIPILTIALGYWGWRAKSDKNKLKAELEGLKASNTEQEIKNQSSWIDLYRKLANDQAERMVRLEEEIKELKSIIHKFEYAFKKAHNCPHFDICPIRDELSKYKTSNRKGASGKGGTNRQRNSQGGENNESDKHSTDHSDTKPDSQTN